MNFKVSLNLQPLYFQLIALGEKVVEGRLKKPPLDTLKLNDVIRFTKNTEEKVSLHAKVVSLGKYASFQEMLTHEGLHRCLPHASSIEEGVRVYHSFPGYREMERIYGVLAIGIQVLKKK